MGECDVGLVGRGGSVVGEVTGVTDFGGGDSDIVTMCSISH